MAEPTDPSSPRTENEDPAKIARTSDDLDHHNTIALSTTPIVTIKIVRLTFKTDHAVMTDYDADWQSSGSVAAKPEWSFGKPGAAVSHTKAQAVGVSADVEVYPTNADPVPCNFTATAAWGSVAFNGSVTLKGGTINVAAVSSPIKLSPDTVAKLTGDIAWKFTPIAGGSAMDAGSSWGHTVYATMDKPTNPSAREAGITRKRMDTAVSLVAGTGSNDPHTIVAGLMKKIPGYTLVTDPAVPSQYKHPTYFNSVGGAWPITDFVANAAECQAIVRWVRALIQTVGCPGTADLVTVWADPLIGNGKSTQTAENDPSQGLDSKKTVAGRTWFAFLVDTYPEVGKKYDIEEITSNYMGLNRYEACLRFKHGGTTKFYGGGAGTYANEDEVLKAFYALVWVSDGGTNAKGKALAKVEEVVRRWRDKSGNLLP